jgi:hypothetical protein
MATAEQIAELRLKISEPDNVEPYTDQVLSDAIDEANGDTNAVAGSIWQTKAASYAEMTDISEAGSSRKNSQLYKQALEMADYFSSQSEGEDAGEAGTDFPTTRASVRA